MTSDRDLSLPAVAEAVEQMKRAGGARAGDIVPGPSPLLLDAADFDPDEHRKQQREVAWAQAIPARFREARVADLPDEVREPIEDWAIGDESRNLVLAGPVGTGKTHAAVAAARARFEAGATPPWFVPAVELFDLLRSPEDGRAYLRRAISERLLIVDDVGAQRDTDWTTERFYALANRRWMEALPTIITTNLTGDAMKESVGEHVHSRLIYPARIVKLTGDDKRRTSR